MIFKLKIGNFNFGVSLFKEGKLDVYGYTNRCIDGKFIIFLDYDDIDLKWILQELEYLQIDYHLSDFYIFESSKNSYHAICFSKVSRNTLIDILKNSSIDENYYKIPYSIGKKLLTLRLTDKNGKKPIFIEKLICYKRRIKRLESKEHKIFFNNFFDGIMSSLDLNANNDLKHSGGLIFSRYKL